ncbi:terpene synthase isoform X1 [Galleria mellonella]|uniref:Terpene synthase isoform X1 n=1 Tax=Galleria mellonella TaxID=7137 RepID=A0ABM3MDW5_GALME|nr:terpene synthase isoform X1 [Galleria mellonella]
MLQQVLNKRQSVNLNFYKMRLNNGCNLSNEEKILLPFTYIQQVPGKQIRTKLTSAFNYWLKVSDEKLRAVGEIVQMLHNSSLLIDDIQDNSILRRGIPVAHSIYGVASTINAANYVLIIALEKSLQLGHPMATAVYTEQLLELHRGQGMEIYWRDNFQCPSEEEYKEMTIKKTGGLFMLAIRLMQLFSENKSDFSKLSAILGLYFQIRDDYCNLCLQEYSENKSFCEDLTEGKFSFPIIHAIRNQEGDNQVLHILRQRTRDVEVKRYCISLLERLGSFRYTRDTLIKLDAEARAEIASLGGNPQLDALLDELLSWRRDNAHNNGFDKQ